MSTLSLDDLVALDAAHHMAVFGRAQVAFVRGEGTELFDTEGMRYLDFLSGLAVTSLGHAHPGVAAAIADQARTLLHVSNLFYNDVQPRLVARLDALLGGGGKVFCTNSGAEANECAIKLARRYAQRHFGAERFHVIGMLGGFHGRTLATLAATGKPQLHEAFQPLPQGFRHVGYGDLDALAGALDERAAAVLVEVIQGEGGVVPADLGYLRDLRRLCDEREVLLVVDEIQTGLGRTGEWFGFEHAGIRPDIVTLAKALGNGMPIGACWARDEVAAAFARGDHGSTYAGQPLAARAALTVLDELERIDAPGLARKQGERLAAALGAVEGVVEIRGRGLLLAAELEPGLDSATVNLALLRAGLVANAVTPTSLRFAPPLLVRDSEIDEAAAIVAGVLCGARS
jgi:predicted acetylornithine/succinylornithine family transaminase